MRRILLVVLLVCLADPASAAAWSWPVDGPVLRPFLFGDDPYAAGQHRGVDVGAPAGAPVRAPASGTVAFAGTVPRGGRTLTIETADGYSVTLVHLGSVSPARGATVLEGQPVGTIGPSGDPEWNEPYVHLGVRVTADRHGYVDPLLFLPARGEQIGAPDDPAASPAGIDAAPGPTPAEAAHA
ncbi:MAG: M23 family metallopeptidase, partial [Thermoleophilia bacterium]|nr:M23 family metallopeptidase [Thermoleophilia bacterium]